MIIGLVISSLPLMVRKITISLAALGIQIGRSDNYLPLSEPSVFTIANLDNWINSQTSG